LVKTIFCQKIGKTGGILARARGARLDGWGLMEIEFRPDADGAGAKEEDC